MRLKDQKRIEKETSHFFWHWKFHFCGEKNASPMPEKKALRMDALQTDRCISDHGPIGRALG